MLSKGSKPLTFHLIALEVPALTGVKLKGEGGREKVCSGSSTLTQDCREHFQWDM